MYIDDFVKIVFRLLKKDLWKNTFNIASGKSITLNELVKILAKKLVSHKFKVNFKEPLENDVDLLPDASFLKAKIHYKSAIGLEEGIERYIDWYKQRRVYGPSAV